MENRVLYIKDISNNSILRSPFLAFSTRSRLLAMKPIYFNTKFNVALALSLAAFVFCCGTVFSQQDIPALKPVPESGSVTDYNSYIYEIQFFRFAAPDESAYRDFAVRQSQLIVAAAEKILENPNLQEAEALEAANLIFERRLLLFEDKPDEYIAEMEKTIDRLRKRGFDLAAHNCADRLMGWEFQFAVSSQDLDRFNKAMTKLDSWLDAQATDLSIEQVQLIQSICQISEYLSGANLQPKLFEKYGTRLASSSDGVVAHIGKSMLGAKRRWELPGKTLTIQGKLLDGTDFNYSKYAGKVVLVEFWATWCGPCCGEIPHLKTMFDKYHGRGFEIVAISLDRDLNELVRFVKEREVPWPQLPAFDTEVDGQPLTEYYGVSSIPMLFLVGRDGKVLSNQARGKVLEQLLSEQFPKEPVNNEK